MCKSPIAFEKINGQKKLKPNWRMTIDINQEYNNPKITWLPCGKCLNCRLTHAKTWQNRVWLEMKEHKESYFLTLTYNEKNIPNNKSLKKRDMQLFIKKIRKKGQKIRYIGSGEYGKKTNRPHYHYIFFGLQIHDLKEYGKNELNQKLFTSKEMNKIWEKGNIIIAPASKETAGYIARYTLKKIGQEKPKIAAKENEYLNMSNRPAIGKKYWEKNKAKITHFDKILIDKKWQKVPRYFDKLLEKQDKFTLENIKNNRKKTAELKLANKLKNTNRKIKKILEDEETILKQKIKKLQKKL